jgi:hypothetical protein
MKFLNYVCVLKTDERVYTSKIEDMTKEDTCRLIVNINDVRRKMPDRAAGYI